MPVWRPVLLLKRIQGAGQWLAGCRWVDGVCGQGRPAGSLHGAAARLARENGIASVISLSHNREHAVPLLAARGLTLKAVTGEETKRWTGLL